MTSPGAVICDVNDTACEVYGALPIVNKLSFGLPLMFNAFVTLTVQNGARRQWANRVRELAEEQPEGTYFAAAHLIGGGPHNAMVEVLSDNEDHLLSLIVDATDIEGVLDARVMRCHARDTRGMGSVVPGM